MMVSAQETEVGFRFTGLGEMRGKYFSAASFQTVSSRLQFVQQRGQTGMEAQNRQKENQE